MRFISLTFFFNFRNNVIYFSKDFSQFFSFFKRSTNGDGKNSNGSSKSSEIVISPLSLPNLLYLDDYYSIL
ncbi:MULTISPECIES: hypothetical protein [unclassified Microcoleus]|uniref:hypothetical protein n=1 Tax=unclassified Microcoleus TaxID=2642155 RepID=UPI002FD08B2F